MEKSYKTFQKPNIMEKCFRCSLKSLQYTVLCGSKLRPNENYDRSIISSYSIIICPTTYWICTNEMCKKHHTDKIIGTGSANYSDEFIDKVNCIRYGSHCSLWNTRFAGEIFTVGLTDDSGRTPCATTI
jgi:hypothetical protein